MWYYRIRETERGRFVPEKRWHASDKPDKWYPVTYKSYTRRGDAQRAITIEIKANNGQWYEGQDQLNDDEKAALTAWAETHEQVIAAETVDASPFDEEVQKRLEFAKWLREQGKLHDELTPADFGLKQPELLDA